MIARATFFAAAWQRANGSLLHLLAGAARLEFWGALVLLPAAAFGHNSFEERYEKLTAAIAREPNNAALHFELAEVYCIEGHANWAGALAELDLAEKLAPGRHPVDLHRGRVLLASQRPAEALAALDRHVQARPEDHRGYQCRARAWQALDKKEECVADFRTALRLTPTVDSMLAREAADALYANGNKDEAVDLLAATLRKLGNVPSLITRAMELELATGRFDDALARVETMQKIWPLPEPWQARRAAILAQAGRLDEARHAWRTLITHIDRLEPPRRESDVLKKLRAEARAALASPPLAIAP